MDGLAYLSATELSARLRAGELSARTVVEAALDRIAATEAQLHAFTHVDAEGALAAAQAADARRQSGQPLGALHGVPLAVKDNIAVRDLPFERGSPLHQGEIAPRDAPAVAKLRVAGAIVVGKTALPEFGHLAFTHSKLGPATRNPWSPVHTCGGSSGGSAAAVAAGLVPLALGTDGGGSIRIPASCCGVVGHKPSLGRVPYVPLPGGLDAISHLGPLARTVEDVARALASIAGPDETDWTTLPAETTDYRSAVQDGVDGGRVAWLPQLGAGVVEPEVLRICEASLEALRAAGCRVETLEPPLSDWREAWRTMFDVMLAALVAGRLDEVRARSDPTFVHVVEAGLEATAVELMSAGSGRRQAWSELAPIFERHAVLVTPTLLAPPLPVDAASGRPADPTAWTDRWFQHVYPFNLTGQPAISVPAGWTAQGLPVGLQIVGPRHADALVLRYAAAFESHLPQGRRPAPQT